MFERTSVDVPLLAAPAKTGLQAAHVVAARRLGEVEAVGPLLDVERPEFFHGQLRIEIDESLEPVAVGFVGGVGAMRLDPLQELVTEHCDGLSRIIGSVAGRLGRGHQLVVLLESLVLIRAEVDLLSADFDVPATVGLAVEGPRESVAFANLQVGRVQKARMRLTHAVSSLTFFSDILESNRRKSSTPQRIRTSNLRFRRPMLYPVELGVQIG